jgi:homoserine kinase type II
VAEAGLPTALPVCGRLGERCITVGEPRIVIEVEEFIASDGKMDSLVRIRRALPVLGRLHDALNSTDLPEAAADVEFANYLSATEATTKTTAGVRRIRSLDRDLHALASQTERLVDDLDAATGNASDELPSQWCHGDYWDNNVLFEGEDVVLIADFGFMGRRPRVDDVALTLYFTLWELVTSGHGEPLDTIVDLVAAYDSGTRRPLTPAERVALPLAVARQPLWSIGVWAAELDDANTVGAHLLGHELAISIGQEIVSNLDRWRAALSR